MFKKILIANRGEIACRVIATAQKLGIKTVAVYSDADAAAKHVAMADESYYLGPSPVAESYLKADEIIDIARRSGAQAIHPGYGFLSENPSFVAAIEEAGLTFIGPSANAIKAMGLKDAAKHLMEEANVPVVPGYHGDNLDTAFLSDRADEIGYPILIKARAGGGGKGMRLVENKADFLVNLESAQREAQSSFGDPVCLIEKYISQPRHIEVQIFGDNHGNVVHLFERDCSLQRRHQKVIEEAPAPGMTDELRQAMGKAAVEAAKAINYSGAGTVEFIVDGSGPLRVDGFWFMEMNTRLQVEHPVSEAITGLDFVELQLRVAAGEALPFRQEDVSIDGWSFEARIYAEDVPKGFLPATGTVSYLATPDASEFSIAPVRIDSSIREGDAISPFYDPMIAKIIVHGATRGIALSMLQKALDEYRVGGSVTNLEFLYALAAHNGFAKGNVDTNLIARDLEDLTRKDPPSDTAIALAALYTSGVLPALKISGIENIDAFAWRHWSPASLQADVVYEGEKTPCRITIHGQDHFAVTVKDQSVQIVILGSDGDDLSVLANDEPVSCSITQRGQALYLSAFGSRYEFEAVDPFSDGANEDEGGDTVIAPMPGLVTDVLAKNGDTVARGDRLLILEAMKMEHALCAPRDAVIEEIMTGQGDQVVEGALLIKLETEDE